MIFTCIVAPDPALLTVGDQWRKEKTGELRVWTGAGWASPEAPRGGQTESTHQEGDPATGRPLTEAEIDVLVAKRRKTSREKLDAETAAGGKTP
jgi:hypothetical protein